MGTTVIGSTEVGMHLRASSVAMGTRTEAPKSMVVRTETGSLASIQRIAVVKGTCIALDSTERLPASHCLRWLAKSGRGVAEH